MLSGARTRIGPDHVRRHASLQTPPDCPVDHAERSPAIAQHTHRVAPAPLAALSDAEAAC